MDEYRFIDLTHTLTESIPSWTGRCGFRHEVKMDYDAGVRVLGYKMHGGVGTHIDAPSHFFPDGENIADMPLENFIVPLSVLDLSHKRDGDLFVQVEDILQYETMHGTVAPKSLFVAYTGWQEFWKDTNAYRNVDQEGKMHFPGFSKKAAEFLVERSVVGIGIDSLSPDGSNTDTFPVHHAMLGSGKYIIENLCNLDKLPAKGAWAIVLPLKIKVGTEAGIRAVGLVPK